MAKSCSTLQVPFFFFPTPFFFFFFLCIVYHLFFGSFCFLGLAVLRSVLESSTPPASEAHFDACFKPASGKVMFSCLSRICREPPACLLPPWDAVSLGQELRWLSLFPLNRISFTKGEAKCNKTVNPRFL